MISEADVGRFAAARPDFPVREAWNEGMARRRALDNGLGELGEEHWRLIHYLRNHFIQYGAPPPERDACFCNRLDAKCFRRLFRNMEEAWRIAGLPEPGEEPSLL